MSVTDKNSSTAALTNIRNTPYGDRPPVEALYKAEVCGLCFGELEADEPVWMASWCAYWSAYLGKYIHRVYAARCLNCSPIDSLRWHPVRDGLWTDAKYYLDYWMEGACKTCGRTVFKEARYMRRHFFCCRKCEENYWSRRRQKQKERKVCEVCGEPFTAARGDAKTCSAACKQKAYRLRRKEGSA